MLSDTPDAAPEAPGACSPEVFSTSFTPCGKDRHSYWNEVTSSTFEGMCYASLKDKDEFDACLKRWSIGDITLVHPVGAQAKVSRWSQGDGECGRQTVMMHVQITGYSRLKQNRRECELGPVSLEFTNGSSPYVNHVSDGHALMAMEIPMDVAERYIPDLPDHYNTAFTHRRPGVRLLHNFLLDLWREGEGADMGDMHEDDVASTVLSLARMAISQPDGPAAPPKGSEEHRKLLAFIEANLHDPSLSTNAMADAIKLSPRQVQYLFAERATTPSAYVQSQRLKRAAFLLAAEPDRTVLDIALASGFGDSSYFARCFRRTFGLSPKEYRRRPV